MKLRTSSSAVLITAALLGGGAALAPTAQAVPAGGVSPAVTAAAVSPQVDMQDCPLTFYVNPFNSRKELVPTYTVREGVNNDPCVATVQWDIDAIYGNPLNNSPLAIDGDFGPKTLSWVRQFQNDHTCDGGTDGIVGRNTASCMAGQISGG